MLWWNTSDVELMLHHITKSMYHFDHKFTSYYYDPSFDKQLTPEILRNASSPQRGSIIVVCGAIDLHPGKVKCFQIMDRSWVRNLPIELFAQVIHLCQRLHHLRAM